MAQSFAQAFTSARLVSAPLVIVRTPDNISTEKIAAESVLAIKHEKLPENPLLLRWDIARGLTTVAQVQGPVLDKLLEKGQLPKTKTTNATESLYLLQRLAPIGTVIFMHNPHLLWSNPGLVQSLANVRDDFKGTARMVVLLCPLGTEPPSEIRHDTIRLNDPLPTEERLAEIVTKVSKQNGITLTEADAFRGTQGVRGLSAFVAETAVSMSLRPKGLAFDVLREQRVEALQSTSGLTVHRGTETFADVIGADGIKADLIRLKNAKNKVKVVVVLDEFGKMLAGSQTEHGDNTGTAQRQSGHILRWMQDKKVRGIIEFGHPGVGKTWLAYALANELGVDCLLAEMDRTLDSKLGASEQNLRNMTDAVDAIAGVGGAFVIATCNEMIPFSTELRRRFTRGTYFNELPSPDVKDRAWVYYGKKFDLDLNQPRPDDTDWTIAEIATCCEQAWDYGITLVEASRNIVPVAKAQPEVIAERRRYAHNKLLDASTGSVYRIPDSTEEGPSSSDTRLVSLQEE